VAARVSWQPVEEISFEYTRADLIPRCQKKIGKLAAQVKQHPTVEVALGVRTNETLTGERDPRIGAARLRVVREALIAEGVAPGRIYYAAADPQRALCKQATPACYERNRRVEVFFGQRY
jgi:outer membrane protein OmpA-like peptidoglycan-associated protein